MEPMKILALVLIALLFVQWALAFLCLMKLFKEGLRGKAFWAWNVFILLGVLVGPVCYLVTAPRRMRKKSAQGEPPRENPGGGDYCI